VRSVTRTLRELDPEVVGGFDEARVGALVELSGDIFKVLDAKGRVAYPTRGRSGASGMRSGECVTAPPLSWCIRTFWTGCSEQR
jgi:hypothetical protein